MRALAGAGALALAVVSLASPAQAAATWAPTDDFTSVKGNVVTLDGEPYVAGDPAPGTSLETESLGMPVEAGDAFTFEYTGECTAGSPRVFLETNGVYDNSWDQNIAANTQCGTDPDGDGWFTVTGTVSQTGTVGHAGLVHDNGSDTTIAVRNLRIDGEKVPFGSANGNR